METRVLDEGDDPAAIAARADTAALGMAGGDARLRALGFALRPPEPLALRVNGESLSAAILLVANNEYRLDALFIGERERLDEGVLALYVTERLLPWRWTTRTEVSFEIDAGSRSVQAAVDGEPVELESPLDVRIEPLGLRLLQPHG